MFSRSEASGLVLCRPADGRWQMAAGGRQEGSFASPWVAPRGLLARSAAASSHSRSVSGGEQGDGKLPHINEKDGEALAAGLGLVSAAPPEPDG